MLNAAVEASNEDVAAAADSDDTVAATSAVNASALALPVAPDGGDPDWGLIVMIWLIALLAPLIALILIVLVGQSSILPRDGGRAHLKYGYGRLTNLQ